MAILTTRYENPYKLANMMQDRRIAIPMLCTHGLRITQIACTFNLSSVGVQRQVIMEYLPSRANIPRVAHLKPTEPFSMFFASIPYHSEKS